MRPVPEPARGIATAADAGRSCPYCRFPMKIGTPVAVCRVCHAPHHGECWEENGGCAVVACAAGPEAGQAQPPPLAPAPPRLVVEREPAAPEPADAPPPPPHGRGRMWIVFAAALIVLAVAGGAAALLLDRHDKPLAASTISPPVKTVTTVKIRTVKGRTPTRPKTAAQRNSTTVAPRITGRYLVSSCGGILDNSTGLEWFVGPDQETSWPGALGWAASLTACGGGWSMPTASQLEGLFAANLSAGTGYFTRGQYYPARIDPVFRGIGGGSWVWTGQEESAASAHAVNLYEDLTVTLAKDESVYPVRAFAVKSAQ